MHRPYRTVQLQVIFEDLIPTAFKHILSLLHLLGPAQHEEGDLGA